MKYLEAAASPRLAHYAESFWQIEGDASASGSTEPIPPDGRMEIVFNRADPFRRYFEDNTTEIQPKTILVGPMTGSALIKPTGRVSLFAIKLNPGGAFALLNFPLNLLTNTIPNLDLIFNASYKEIEERINLADCFAARIRIAESWFTTMIGDSRPVDRHTGEFKAALAAETIIRTDGRVSIDQLARDLGLTSRHLERLFRSTIGIGPKLLSRIIRFQRVFKTIERQPKADWSSVAYDCGYYDQAHLIRDFRQFSGLNPSAYLRQEHEISDYLVKRAPMSDFSNTTL